MAENDGNDTFDPHSAPTVMEMSPIFQAKQTSTPSPAPSGGGPVNDAIALLKHAFEMYKAHFALFIITAAVAMGPVYLLKNAVTAMFAAPASMVSTGLEAQSRKVERLSEELQRKVAAGAPQSEIDALQQEVLNASSQLLAGSGVAAGGMVAGALAGFGLFLLSIPLLVLATFLAQGALVVAVNDRLGGGSMDWKGAWGVVAGRATPLILTSLLAAAAVLVGTLACVLPGLVVGFFLAFAMPIVLLERKSGVDALKRSYELVRGDWLRVLIVAIAYTVLSWVAAFIGGLFIPSRWIFVHGFIGDLMTILVLPVPIICLVLLYDSVTRKLDGAAVADARRAQLLS